MSKQAIGVSQELGRSCRLHLENRLGEVPHRNLLAPGRRRTVREIRRQAQGVVPPSEGNEVRRDGRQEVVAS